MKFHSNQGKILLFIILVALVVMGGCAAPVPAATPTPAPAPTSYTVNTASKADIGNYLVDGKGMTLYYFTKDEPGKSNATAAVIANWPIFYTSSIVVPASLNAADFGTITGTGGNMQTTYKGWPLYYFIKDQAAGDTSGQGVNSVWFVIDPASFPPKPASAPSPTPTGSVTINLIAKNIAFDKSTITVPAGAQVTINFNNQDSGIPHNFAVYTDTSATKSIFVGGLVSGPKTVTYNFTAPATPGNYFFRCDVHPNTMMGTLVVTAR